MWKDKTMTILSGHTYEFRHADSCIRVELAALSDGFHRIIPKLVVRGRDKEGVRAFLRILPVTGDIEYTTFTLQSGVDIALMKGWQVNDLTENGNAK